MNLTNDKLALLALCRIPGIRWDLIAREAQRAGDVSHLLRGEVYERSTAGNDARTLISAAQDTHHERMLWVSDEHERAVSAGARLITVCDVEYPKNLRVIVNLPPFLYVRGVLSNEDAWSVAVVGTRRPSSEGEEKARKMAHLLSERGVTVVSGMASGIDTAAHESALRSGGRTIAVMGTGILNRYPKENAELSDQIIHSGAIVSQFCPSAPPRGSNFPLRNVVTSGISQGTVVIEASSTSGAKMQARLAIEHGKTVFLVESLVMQEKWAQDYVARHGKRVVVVKSVEDVMSHLRTVEEVAELTTQRHQLAFDLA